jgi:hypothetical protein
VDDLSARLAGVRRRVALCVRLFRDSRRRFATGARYLKRPSGRGPARSPGITYPSGWEVTVPGGVLNVRPLQKDQELVVAATLAGAYWEGDSAVSGIIEGRPVKGCKLCGGRARACPWRRSITHRKRSERAARSFPQKAMTGSIGAAADGGGLRKCRTKRVPSPIALH